MWRPGELNVVFIDEQRELTKDEVHLQLEMSDRKFICMSDNK